MKSKEKRVIYIWQLRTLWRHRKELVITGKMPTLVVATVMVSVLPNFVEVSLSFPLGVIQGMFMATIILFACSALFLRFRMVDSDKSNQIDE